MDPLWMRAVFVVCSKEYKGTNNEEQYVYTSVAVVSCIIRAEEITVAGVNLLLGSRQFDTPGKWPCGRKRKGMRERLCLPPTYQILGRKDEGERVFFRVVLNKSTK